MKHRYKILLLKTILIISTLVIVFGILYFAAIETVPDLLPLLEHGNQEEIEVYITSAGPKGIIFTSLLQIIQVLTVVFPGMPIQITAGIIYGGIGGYLICHLSYVLANIMVFEVARKFGSKLNELVSVEARSQKLSFIKNSEHPSFMVFLACLMPVVPNGFIPYVAARTKISQTSFVTSVFCGSLPSILIFCVIGNRILKGDFLLVGLLCTLLIVLIILLLLFKDKLMNRVLSFSDKFFHK